MQFGRALCVNTEVLSPKSRAATFLGGSGSRRPRSRSRLRLQTKRGLQLQAKKGGSRHSGSGLLKELIQFLATLVILHQDDEKKGKIHPILHIVLV